MDLWLVGRWVEHEQWEVMGVFTSEQSAVVACTGPKDFVGYIQADVRLPDKREEWPGAYYPAWQKKDE